MSKNTNTIKPTNGKSFTSPVIDSAKLIAEKAEAAFVAEISAAAGVSPVIEPEAVAIPEPVAEIPVPVTEPVKQMTMLEKIQKIENLQLLIEKRAKLVQTRSELERFQTQSNDFNCSMRLNDSDGNVFTTSFTPGIKKVIDFLKSSFDASITDVENKITF